MNFFKFNLSLLFLLVSFSVFGGETEKESTVKILAENLHRDPVLSLMLAGTNAKQETEVYTSEENAGVTVQQLQAKGIGLKKWEKKEEKIKSGKKPLPGLQELKSKASSEPSDYEIYSAITEDREIIVVASHYFDSEEKKWVKKTHVTLIRTIPPDEGIKSKTLPVKPVKILQ